MRFYSQRQNFVHRGTIVLFFWGRRNFVHRGGTWSWQIFMAVIYGISLSSMRILRRVLQAEHVDRRDTEIWSYTRHINNKFSFWYYKQPGMSENFEGFAQVHFHPHGSTRVHVKKRGPTLIWRGFSWRRNLEADFAAWRPISEADFESQRQLSNSDSVNQGGGFICVEAGFRGNSLDLEADFKKSASTPHKSPAPRARARAPRAARAQEAAYAA